MKKQLMLVSAIAALAFNSYAYAENAASSVPAVSSTQQKQIEDVVHHYLVNNPQVLMEAAQAFQTKQMEETRKAIQKTQQVAAKFADALFRQANNPFAGNQKGKITIVDFFDYQCPHCKMMNPTLEDIIKANPEVRVVYKEFPIKGPMSEFAAKAALAAKNQGKYVELNKALMKQDASQPQLTEEGIINVAKSIGLDIEKLKADMKSDAISKQIKDTYELAQKLQLMGTPALFIAKSDVKQNGAATDIVFVPGRVEKTQLESIIKKMNS